MQIMANVIGSVGAAAVLIACVFVNQPATAADGDLAGSWSGAGRVVLPSGDTERARCRVTFRHHSGGHYGMNAVCATASARVAQEGTVQRVSTSVYTGRFYNAEYNVEGTVRLDVKGSRMTAAMSGGGGSAVFTLAK